MKKIGLLKKGVLLAILSLSLQTVYSESQTKAVVPKNTQHKSICKKISVMLKQPAYSKGSLEEKVISRVLDSDRYTNLDIDQDGVDDSVSGSCSQSSPPTDPCVLSYQASTTSKSVAFEFPIQDRFYLVKIDQNIYAIAINSKNQKKRPKKYKVFNLTPIGVEKVCK